jgi:DNA-binding transcriptional LysR family regulator
LDYKVTLEAGGWEVIKKYVELGLGISIVTDLCLTGEEKLGRVPLERFLPRRSYGIVLRRGKFLSPQTKRFQEIMDLVYPDDAVDSLGRQRRGEGDLGDGLMG